MSSEGRIVELNFNNSEDLDAAFPIISQLRPHLNRMQFAELIQKMAHENYKLWAYIDRNKVLGLVSTRVYTDFVRGAHVYIDDLVTDQNSRSLGVGAAILKHAERLATNLKLPSLRLCCATENESGLKFYKREGWKERSLALVKKVSF